MDFVGCTLRSRNKHHNGKKDGVLTRESITQKIPSNPVSSRQCRLLPDGSEERPVC